MSDNNSPNWERKVIESLAVDALREQRARRRWGIFFKLLGFAYLTVVLMLAFDWPGDTESLAEGKKHTAVIDLTGVISHKGDASAENINAALQDIIAGRPAHLDTTWTLPNSAPAGQYALHLAWVRTPALAAGQPMRWNMAGTEPDGSLRVATLKRN